MSQQLHSMTFWCYGKIKPFWFGSHDIIASTRFLLSGIHCTISRTSTMPVQCHPLPCLLLLSPLRADESRSISPSVRLPQLPLARSLPREFCWLVEIQISKSPQETVNDCEELTTHTHKRMRRMEEKVSLGLGLYLYEFSFANRAFISGIIPSGILISLPPSLIEWLTDWAMIRPSVRPSRWWFEMSGAVQEEGDSRHWMDAPPSGNDNRSEFNFHSGTAWKGV